MQAPSRTPTPCLLDFDETISFLQKGGQTVGLCEKLIPCAWGNNPKAQETWQEFRRVVFDWKSDQYKEASEDKQKMWGKRRKASGYLSLIGGMLATSCWCGCLFMDVAPFLLAWIGFFGFIGTGVLCTGICLTDSKTSLQNAKENPFLRARSLATILLGLETSEQPHQKEVYALLQKLHHDNKLNAYFWKRIEETHNKYLINLKEDISSSSSRKDQVLVVTSAPDKNFHF